MYNNQEIIKSLREKGYKVGVSQLRPLNEEYASNPIYSSDAGKLLSLTYFKQNGITQAMATKGGKTVVAITTPDGRELIREALCSKKETFCYKRGLAIALGRAVVELGIRG